VKQMKMSVSLACTAVSFVGAIGVAGAQTPPTDANASSTVLEEVVVTAQRRAENLQDVPITVSAVGRDALAAANVTSLQGLSTIVSGYTGPGDIAFTSPHIRGVGSQVGSPGLENSVALYVDGIYIGATSPALLRLSDVDVDQVEVLKGPQGTLFGRNTTGGLVQVLTRNPDQAPEIDLQVGYANYQTISGTTYINLPVNDNVSTNLAVSSMGAGQGWGTNEATGNPSYKLNSEISARNKWNIDLGSNTSLMLMGDYEYHNDLGFFDFRPVVGTVIAPTYTSTVSGWNTNTADANDLSEAWGLTARLTHSFDFATLSNTVAYRDTRFDLVNFVGDRAAPPYDDDHFYWFTQDQQWTDELQLASNGDSNLKWTTGVFYYHAIDINHQPITSGMLAADDAPFLTGVTDSTITTSSIAPYLQASYEFATGTTLTAGARYSFDHHSMTGTFNNSGLPIGPGGSFIQIVPDTVETLPAFSDGSLSARVALAHKFTSDAMVYVSFNEGTKSGGFNPVQINNAPFKDEKLSAYELGTKLRFWDRRVSLDLSGFYYDYRNIQVQSFLGGPPTIYNGPSARLYGVDADMQVQVTRDFNIRGNLEALHSQFGNFPTAQFLGVCDAAHVIPPLVCPQGPGVGYYSYFANAQGNSLPLAPDFTGALIPSYRFHLSSGTVELAANYNYNSGYFFSVGHEFGQKSFSMVGASLQFTTADERTYVRIWGANLGNTQAYASGSIQTDSTSVVLSAPRTYGVTVGVKFR
jgi:iron complex outermembrane receptor protein